MRDVSGSTGFLRSDTPSRRPNSVSHAPRRRRRKDRRLPSCRSPVSPEWQGSLLVWNTAPTTASLSRTASSAQLCRHSVTPASDLNPFHWPPRPEIAGHLTQRVFIGRARPPGAHRSEYFRHVYEMERCHTLPRPDFFGVMNCEATRLCVFSFSLCLHGKN